MNITSAFAKFVNPLPNFGVSAARCFDGADCWPTMEEEEGLEEVEEWEGEEDARAEAWGGRRPTLQTSWQLSGTTTRCFGGRGPGLLCPYME